MNPPWQNNASYDLGNCRSSENQSFNVGMFIGHGRFFMMTVKWKRADMKVTFQATSACDNNPDNYEQGQIRLICMI